MKAKEFDKKFDQGKKDIIDDLEFIHGAPCQTGAEAHQC